MRTIAAALAAITFASALGAADKATLHDALDVAALPQLRGDRALAASEILSDADARKRAVEAQLHARRDSYTLTVLAVAKQAIRQDAEDRLAAILTEEEMANLRLFAPAPGGAIGSLRFLRV